MGRYHDVVTLEAVHRSNTKPLPHKQLYYPTTLSHGGIACACWNPTIYSACISVFPAVTCLNTLFATCLPTHQHLVVLYGGSAGHFWRLAGRTADTLHPSLAIVYDTCAMSELSLHVYICTYKRSDRSSPTHFVFNPFGSVQTR